MVKVKIKCADPRDPRRSNKLLEILSCNDVYITRLIPVNDGYVVLTSSNSDLDKIFNNETDKQLEQNNFNPQIPPELSANRSVLLFNADNHIFCNSDNEIKAEIKERNEWVGETVDALKFDKGNIIKVTFTDTNKAKLAQENGLKMFSMKIPKHDIKQCTHINILTCLRCYMMEDHSTAQCSKDRTYKVCSECSSHNHTWRECKVEIKKCITCKGQHSTMAMKCPKRKEIQNQKRKEEREREGATYTDILKKNRNRQAQAVQPQPASTPSNNPTHITIHQAMLHSHYVNIDKPGSYTKTFNDLMTAHNLPTLNIQEEPNSLEIISKLLQAENNRTPTCTQTGNTTMTNAQAEGTQAESMETATIHVEEEDNRQKVTHEKETVTTQEEENSRQKVTHETETEETETEETETEETEIMQQSILTQGKKTYPVKGEDIGFMVYTKQSVGWPKKVEFTRLELVKGFKNKKYKYTYTKKDLTDNEIIKMIENRLLDIPARCFSIVDDSTFGKVRTGLMEEKTPPPSKERRRKDSYSSVK